MLLTTILFVMGTTSTTVGAFIIGWNDIMGKKEALEVGLSRISGDTDEENLQLPAVRELLKRSRNSKRGLLFVLLGYVFLMLTIAIQSGVFG